MNAQQLNAAIGVSIGEVLKSCARREIDPAQIIGVLEMHKCAIIAHLQASQEQQPQIIPFRGKINGQ